MKERPILFSGPMVRAILEGRKTQTRRVVKIQNLPGAPSSFKAYEFEQIKPDGRSVMKFGFEGGEDDHIQCVCPYGRLGDYLWVRETWASDLPINELRKKLEDVYQDRSYGPFYRATMDEDERSIYRFKPSIHMPRCASRIDLLIKNVRVERLQRISEEDALAEGPPMQDKDGVPYGSGRHAFMALWDRINFSLGKGWETNPWVWVVEFEMEKP